MIATPRPEPGSGVVYGRGQATPAAPPPPGPPPYPVWPAPQPYLAPRPQRRSLPWVLGSITAAMVLAVLTLGAVVAIGSYAGSGVERATWRAAPEPTALMPDASAPVTEWNRWARRAINDIAEAQARALLAGDEEAYLAPVDPEDEDLIVEHQRRFKVLRAMGLGVWTQTITGLPTDRSTAGDRMWDAKLRITYCFGEPTCQPAQLVVGSKWAMDEDRLLLVGLSTSDASQAGPRPWETDDLSVAASDRVVVASQKANAWRLPEALRAGNEAAVVADRMAKWADPPSRYVVFLAGPDDWERWYGEEQPEWAAGRAVDVGPGVREIVIRTEVVLQRELETLLTHEFIHVTTLAGDSGGGSGVWWLVEGIADYATMIDRPVRSYDAFGPTREFVRGRWDGSCAVDPPGGGASLEDASGRYGVAFLAVRHLAEAYSEEKLLEFFGHVVHEDDSLQAASLAVFGEDWADVREACAAYVRDSVG